MPCTSLEVQNFHKQYILFHFQFFIFFGIIFRNIFIRILKDQRVGIIGRNIMS